MDIEEFNKKYAGKCTASIGKGGLTFIKVQNDAATAEICLMGAHVTSYIPKGQPDVLWMSSEAVYKEGTPLRGGVPVCWPWFSKNTAFPDGPTHGVARNLVWDVKDVSCDGSAATTVTLSLSAVPGYEQFWKYAFALEFKVTVASSLTMALKTTNLGKEPFVITEALHTYFNVGDITKVAVEGFDGLPFLNKVGTPANSVRKGTIFIDQEVDEVYQNASGKAVIKDASLGRSITVDKRGSNSSVVWNPWIAKSQRMADFPNDGYKTMLCVETAHANEDARTVAPGESLEMVCIITSKQD